VYRDFLEESKWLEKSEGEEGRGLRATRSCTGARAETEFWREFWEKVFYSLMMDERLLKTAEEGRKGQLQSGVTAD